MTPEKIIYILIGQKGSGKSFIGTIIQEIYGIEFVRVEDIARQLKKNRTVDDESYHKEAFFQIESHLRETLKSIPALVFESTGLTSHFDDMLVNLQRDYHVITIGVKADSELCLERIKNRDRSIHINVSDKEVTRINSLVLQKNRVCDYELRNDGSREELIGAVGNIFIRNQL